MSRFDAFIMKHVWWLVLVLAAILLILHSAKSEKIVVDNTSIVLLIVILLSPFGSAIKKIKLGGLEAEIAPSEINRVADEAAESLSKSPRLQPAKPEAREAIRKLAETDIVLALAKIRIELEARLRKLHLWAGNPSRRPPTVLQMVRQSAVVRGAPPEDGRGDPGRHGYLQFGRFMARRSGSPMPEG